MTDGCPVISTQLGEIKLRVALALQSLVRLHRGPLGICLSCRALWVLRLHHILGDT
jgi:hypothetical protein